MKLNLGSGGAPMEGDDWVNVDAWPDSPGVDVVHDLNNPLPYEDESVEEVKAFDVLEHFSYHTAGRVLSDWIRVLKPGGVITIRCPDFDELCLAFVERRLDYLRAIQLMFGGQSTPYDCHYIGINWPWLNGQLQWWGCIHVERIEDPLGEDWALVVRATKGTRSVLVRDHRGAETVGAGG